LFACAAIILIIARFPKKAKKGHQKWHNNYSLPSPAEIYLDENFTTKVRTRVVLSIAAKKKLDIFPVAEI
jgi:hypothetical protein